MHLFLITYVKTLYFVMKMNICKLFSYFVKIIYYNQVNCVHYEV